MDNEPECMVLELVGDPSDMIQEYAKLTLTTVVQLGSSQLRLELLGRSNVPITNTWLPGKIYPFL